MLKSKFQLCSAVLIPYKNEVGIFMCGTLMKSRQGLFQRISDYYWKRIFDRRELIKENPHKMQLKVLKQEYGAKLFEILPKGNN
jgi:hypothetical protein